MNANKELCEFDNQQNEKTAAILDQFVLHEHCKMGVDIDALIAQAQEDAITS